MESGLNTNNEKNTLIDSVQYRLRITSYNVCYTKLLRIESYSTVWYRTINTKVILELPKVQSDTPGHISTSISADLLITLR